MSKQMFFGVGLFKKKELFYKKNQKNKPRLLNQILKNTLWFGLGAFLGFFFFISFLFLIYQKTYNNYVYIGVFVDGVDFSGKTKSEVKNYFKKLNLPIEKYSIQITSPDISATLSARQVNFGYDEDLLAEQAFSVGRSDNQFSNFNIILQAYFNQINLPKSYRYTPDNLDSLISPIQKKINIQPVDALFTFANQRVTAFTLSQDGQAVDTPRLKENLYKELIKNAEKNKQNKIAISVPIKILKPKITNENINSFGIRELIGEGTSLFHHSIENRIYNIQLAASRLNGVLIAPDETFSFDKAVGDISSFTGYKQAYVIENGHTVLGDGGGVCQVSTTLFRAALHAGLPIIERNQHAYRVGYYEQDSGPGIDAAVYSPSVDMKFKNDTGHYILIQSFADTDNLRLTFDLYGTSDNRESTITEPVILSQTPAPDPLYQDDPTLPKGEVKQIDFAAGGANVYFTRTVKRNGKTIISDKFTSNYRPWQAVFLRGTKE